MIKQLATFLFTLYLTGASPCFAETPGEMTNKFQQLFTTAGYSTIFGAATGAAVLGLSKTPSEKLEYIAIGASLGFISGSIFGSYIAFSPMINSNSPTKDNQFSFDLSIAPIFRSLDQGKLPLVANFSFMLP
ncbi:MAG: hypothetical protein CMP11_02175 [Zetaproteobacteria bacterium]|nr:hypothetical protein [Pseudobdellovibrionaceae bacterium]